MKIALRIGILFLFLVSFVKAQNNDLLKDFLNKNDIAIRSVQKNMITGNAVKDEILFKKLLKAQVFAVYVFETGPQVALEYAYYVRKECLSFLKKNTKGSLEYFNITDQEEKEFKQTKGFKPDFNGMSTADSDAIEKTDINDTNVFSLFKTAIR